MPDTSREFAEIIDYLNERMEARALPIRDVSKDRAELEYRRKYYAEYREHEHILEMGLPDCIVCRPREEQMAELRAERIEKGTASIKDFIELAMAELDAYDEGIEFLNPSSIDMVAQFKHIRRVGRVYWVVSFLVCAILAVALISVF